MMWCQAPERRLLRSAIALAAVLTLGACEFPTEAPQFQPRFVVPSETTTLPVTQLLPSSITVVNGTFQLALTPATINRTLAQLCSCVVPAGTPVPYPGFTATVATEIALPAEVASAALASGSIALSVQNTFGFDPLNPPGATTAGNMVATIRSGTTTLGTTTITGPFASGTTKNATVALTPATISGPITISIAITSPAGGLLPSNFVTANANGALNVTATPQAIAISSANVAVSNKQISVEAVTLDLSDIDEDIASHAVSGAIILKMSNPFSVGGTLQLRIQGNGVNITKNVTVAAGSTTQRVEFTGPEIRSILGKDVTLSITGPVTGTGAGATVSVTPTQILSIETSLDLVVQVGGTVGN